MKLLPIFLSLAVFAAPLGAPARLVTTEAVLESEDVARDRARVRDFLARADVRAQMQALGVDPLEAAARLDALSDAEVRQVAGRLDELPAGQSTVGVIVGAAVFIFLVLLVTDLLGLTKVFPFTR